MYVVNQPSVCGAFSSLAKISRSKVKMNSMKRQKDMTLKYELPRSVGVQYATGDQWRNDSRKNEGMEPKQKQHPVVNGTSDRSKIPCCKEQYCEYRGRSQDGGGIGRGDHFLFYKFIERTTER